MESHLRLSSGPTPARETMTIMAALWNDQRGATAIEYGLIMALVCIPVMYGIGYLAGGINNSLMKVYTKLYLSNSLLFNLET